MKLKGIALAGLVCISVWACKKNFPEQTEEQKALQEDTYAASALLSVEGMLNELEFIIKQAPAESQTGTILSCAAITKQTTAQGYKIDLVFSSGTLCTDQNYRSGKLSITYNTTTGDILLQPTEYVLAGTLITGTYSFKKATVNNVDKMELMIPNGKFSLTDGSFIKFHVERETKVKAANSSTDISDDDIEVEDSDYELEIGYPSSTVVLNAGLKTAYTLKYSCQERFRPRAGSLTMQRSNGKKRLIDFGTGNCTDVPRLSDAP